MSWLRQRFLLPLGEGRDEVVKAIARGQELGWYILQASRGND